MTAKDKKKLIDYWIKASNLDFESSKLIALSSRQYVQSCFLLHLSTEKILKALAVKTLNDHAPYTHSLLLLAKKSNLELNQKQKQLLSELTEFNLECRYPDENFKIYKKATQKKTENLLNQVEEFKLWILKKLKE